MSPFKGTLLAILMEVVLLIKNLDHDVRSDGGDGDGGGGGGDINGGGASGGDGGGSDAHGDGGDVFPIQFITTLYGHNGHYFV